MAKLNATLSFDLDTYAGVDNETLVIDARTREIYIPDPENVFGVQYDKDSKYVKFKVMNEVSEVFKMEDALIRINYRDSKGIIGSSLAVDKVTYYDTCEFSWIVPNNALKNKGDLYFVVSAVVVDDDGIIQKRWSTTLARVVTPESIYSKSASLDQNERDEIAMLLLLVSEKCNQAIADIGEARDTGVTTITNIKDSGIEELNDLISKYGIRFEDLNVLKSRIDQLFDSGNLPGSNTEVTDIRIGYDGKIYSTAGNAVRIQISNIMEMILDNNFYTPLLIDRDFELIDEENNTLQADWQYKVDGSYDLNGDCNNMEGSDNFAYELENLRNQIKFELEQTKAETSELKEDLVTLQKPYLINPKITNNSYVNAEGTILGYDGWDMADIPVIAGDKVIVYSPVDSKYNAMFFANYGKYKNIVLKQGMNYIDIPDGYRSLVISNEREILKKVLFFVIPTQAINSNKEKLKTADSGKCLFEKILYTIISNVDGTEQSSDTYSSSDYIDLTGHKKFVIECQEDSENNALYDESYNFVQKIEYKAGCTEFDIPTNAKYLRISCHTNFLETASVIFDSSISYRNFTHEDPVLPRKQGWESDRETIIDEAYSKLLNAYKENPDIIPIFVCTDSHRWSPQHPQRYVNNIDTDGMKITNINLGDDVTEHWDDLKFDTIYNNIRYIKNYIGVCGNHDKRDGTSTTEYFLRRIFTSKKARYIAKSKRCCYTVNNDLHNVKYIVFDPYYAPNSGVPMVSVPTVIATWLVKELSKNDGYDIIFLNHQPLTDNNIHRDGTKQTWKMESYELPIFTALFDLLKARKNKLKGTYTDTDGINHNYDFSQCENELLCLIHGHSHEELYYFEDGLLSYCCDWDGAESNGYKSTFIAIDRNAETFTAWIAKGNEQVLDALTLKITK